jgi:hypothetical protein
MEILVVFSTQVKVWEELVTPKLVPLILPKIKVGAEVTLIDSVIHAFKVFKTPDIVLKDTPIMKRPIFQPIPLCALVDDLVARVK